VDFLEITQRVKRESGRSSSGASPATIVGASQPDLDIFNAVNDAWRDVQLMPRKWRWMWLQALATVGVDNTTYTAASLGAPTWARWKTESVDYRPSMFDPANAQTEWDLRFVDYDTFARAFLKGSHAAGASQYWSIANDGSFLIGPKPNLAYTLRADYYVKPQELTADDHIPAMPDQFHILLVWKALESVAISDNAPEKLAKAQNMAGAILDALILDQGEQLRFTAYPLR